MKKLTPKQEGFCKSYVETGNASEAYRLNYSASKMSDAVLNNEASKLVNHHGITMRLEQIKQAHSERHNITVDGITAMYKEVIANATASTQFGPAVSAITGLAKLHGLLTDKVEVTDNSIADRLAAARKLRNAANQTKAR